MSGRTLTATLFVLVVVLGMVSMPAGSAASSPTGVQAVVFDDGQLRVVTPDGGAHDLGADATVTGRPTDLDSDGGLETPFVDSGGTLSMVDPDGTTTALAESAAASKSAIAVGDLDGDGTPAVFYPNSSDSGYVYKVEIGAEPSAPTRVTTTAANGVAGVGDLDGDGDPELGFAGSSSTIKLYDDGAVESTGYSSIGANNGYGLGGVTDFDGDGVARVSLIDGSNNVVLVAADGSTETISSVSAAKSSIAAADWNGDDSPEILYLDSDGKLAYTTLDGEHTRVRDADGNAVNGSTTVGVAASGGLAAPDVVDYAVTNPSGREITVSVTTDKRIETLAVNVSGPDGTTLDTDAFAVSGDGPYSYTATYRAGADGNYTATVETVVGVDGNHGPDGQQRSIEIGTPAPTIENATIADATDGDGAVGGNQTVSVTAEVPDVDPGNVTVTTDATALGAGVVDLAHANGSTYEARITVDGSAVPEDGSQRLVVTATNQYDNDASATTGLLTVDTTPPAADAGPDVTAGVGTTVTFDGDGSTDLTGIESYRWELGDGTTPTGRSVTHVYDTAGTYTVTLAVTDAVGNTATDTLTVTVEESESTTDSGSESEPDPTPTETPTPTPTSDDSGSGSDDGSTSDGSSTADGGGETIVVEEGTTVETRVDDAGVVRVDVSNAEAGNAVSLSIPADEVSDRPAVTVERMTVLPTRSGGFEISVEGNATAPAGVVPVNRDRVVDPLSYWTVGHSIDDDQVAGVSFEFTVRSALLDGADPDDLTLYRYHDGDWTAYDPQVMRGGDTYRYRARSPGLSTFAVAVREPDLAVENATLNDDTIRTGESVTATATVVNDGSDEIVRNLTFRLGGETMGERTVTVPPHADRSVSFVHEPTRTGTFDATVAGEAVGTLTVTSPTATPTASPAPTETPAAPTSTGTPSPPTRSGFGGPILALAALPVCVLVYYYLTRRAGYRSFSERFGEFR